MSIICVLAVISAFYDLLAALRVPFGAFDASWNAFDTVLGLRRLLERNWRANLTPFKSFGENRDEFDRGVVWYHSVVSTSIQTHSIGANPTPRRVFAQLGTYLRLFWTQLDAARAFNAVHQSFQHLSQRTWTSFGAFDIFRNAFGRCSGLLAYFATHLDAARGFWHISQRI